MKVSKPFIGLLSFAFLVIINVNAQKENYYTNNGLVFGFGFGKSNQNSDIANSKGFGYDLTFGSKLYKKENAFLSVEWKFRFLGGNNSAFDHRINADNTYSNIKYNFNNYDIEIGLTLNRLRERSRLVITGFAGAGLTYGRTFTDIYDAGNVIYDFSSINPNQDRSLIYESLRSLSDQNFETTLVKNAAILPTAGIFIGYQLSKSITIGFEYKSNFYLSEDNGSFGMDIDNKILPASAFDRNTYLNFGLQWQFSRGSESAKEKPENIPHVTVLTVPAPTVTFTDPSEDAKHITSSNYSIKAKLAHVTGQENISFFQNAFPNNSFTFNPDTEIFIANVRLRDGENAFRIKVNNQSGSAEDLVNIIKDNSSVESLSLPVIGIISPSRTLRNTEFSEIRLSANMRNIVQKQDIELFVNEERTDFEFDTGSGTLIAYFKLKQGDNSILIKGKNKAGSAQDQLSIKYTTPKKLDPPVIKIIQPSAPQKVQNRNFNLRVMIQNVHNRNDIRIKVNGITNNNISFYSTGEVYANLQLSEGVNNIDITAENEDGQAADQTIIIYENPRGSVQIPSPEIFISEPEEQPFHTYNKTEKLVATISNVSKKEDVRLTVNGSVTNDFSYNPSNGELVCYVRLIIGNNVVNIEASNNTGNDIKKQSILREIKPCPKPMIKLIDPAKQETTSIAEIYNFISEVDNIASGNQLKLSVNGINTSFSFNNATVSSKIRLPRGNNSITLSAVNDCGEAHATTSIIYNPPLIKPDNCKAPEVNIKLNKVNNDATNFTLVGLIKNINSKTDISLIIDGINTKEFRFSPESGILKSDLKLNSGIHTIVLNASNNCGADSKTITATVDEPCSPPKIDFTINEADSGEESHILTGRVSDVRNKTQISLEVNGKLNESLEFTPASGKVSAKFKFMPGTYLFVLHAWNTCGAESKTETLVWEKKEEVQKEEVQNEEVQKEEVQNEEVQIEEVQIEEVQNEQVQIVDVQNEEVQIEEVQNEDVQNEDVQIEDVQNEEVQNEEVQNEEVQNEEVQKISCEVRINPGNANWQFCMVTPTSTFTCDNLKNADFAYSGPASSVFFMPIGGGGQALVKGKPYTIRPGQYYYFSGDINVSISSGNSAAMGQWSLCISADRAPETGSGKMRPKSPCEVDESKSQNSKNKKL